jgi:hypothetical protein
MISLNDFQKKQNFVLDNKNHNEKVPVRVVHNVGGGNVFSPKTKNIINYSSFTDG